MIAYQLVDEENEINLKSYIYIAPRIIRGLKLRICDPLIIIGG